MNRLVPLLGVLALLVLLGVTRRMQGAEKVPGKIQKVSVEERKFILTDEEGRNWIFQANLETRVQLDGKDCDLAALKPGDPAEVTYRQEGPELMATEVRAKRGGAVRRRTEAISQQGKPVFPGGR